MPSASLSADGLMGPPASSSSIRLAVFSLPFPSPIPTLSGMSSRESAFERKGDAPRSTHRHPTPRRSSPKSRRRVLPESSFTRNTRSSDSTILRWIAAKTQQHFSISKYNVEPSDAQLGIILFDAVKFEVHLFYSAI